MEFLYWHYTQGTTYIIQSWIAVLNWINHYFSLPLLLLTLFSPWKRMVEEDTGPGFNPARFFQVLTFNFISRFIGAIVRFILFWVGIIFLIFAFFGGIAGILFWIILPFFGYPVYKKWRRQPKQVVQDLLQEIKSSPKPPLQIIFSNDAGKFILNHIGIGISEIVESGNTKDLDFSKFKPEDYQGAMQFLIDNKVWSKNFYREHEITPEDISLTAKWWDDVRSQKTLLNIPGYGRPAIALELLFGYTPTLNQYSVDLSAPQSYSHRLIGREGIVKNIERTLTTGNSVVLIGAPGVGKKTIVLEFAHRAAQGKLGKKMAFKRVMELDYNFVLSGAADINKKKTEFARILKESAYAGNIILMIRDIHRLTNPEVEGVDFTDVFEKYLGEDDLNIIAVTTPKEYERFIAPNLRLRKHLKKVTAEPPTQEQAMEILIEAAQNAERTHALTIRMPALRKILRESDRFITETPFPEKAIELLDAVITYAGQQQKNLVTVQDTDLVLEEKTGISFTALTETEKEQLGNLEEIIHERLINQDNAVNLIGRSLRARTIGVSNDKRPLGSFLFLGPTGVGKTETAKVLARVYYGSEDAILRFDMAEYAGREGLERLIGSVEKNLPGVLTTAIKNKPASLLLLDEFEKATPEIYNLFLRLLDEGVMTDAFGNLIGAQHLFVIGTSNAGAEHIRQLVSKGIKGKDLQENVVNYVLEKGIYSPEFLNRFDAVVVYEPLESEHLEKIAKLLLNELKENLEQKGIVLNITNELVKHVATEGYNPEFGARPMGRIINLDLGDAVGKAIIKGEIDAGDKIKIIPDGKQDYEIVKSK